VLFLRMKQAETALKDGRLDEAYELLGEADVRDHRRGQELTSQLVQALLDRGRGHLENDQPEQAHTDAAKAQQLGGNLQEVAQLQSAAAEAIINRQRQDRHRNQKLQQARQFIEDGRLSVGEQILTDTVVNGQHGQALKAQVAEQRARIASYAKQAQGALDRDDLLAAIEVIAQTSATERAHQELALIWSNIRKLSNDMILQDIQSGRIDLAQTLLNRLAAVGDESLEISNLEKILLKCRRACTYLSRSQPRQAVEVLRQLKSLLPTAVWVDDAVTQAEQAAAALEGLGAGPLGLMITNDSHICEAEILKLQNKPNLGGPDICEGAGVIVGMGEKGEKVIKSSRFTVHSSREEVESKKGEKGVKGERLPEAFVVQVDGVGSYLVVRKSFVTVGPVSSSQKPDIGVIAEPSLPVVGIERTEGDYFLRSNESIQVKGNPVKDKLLANGDRIGLSPRCRIKFEISNAASSTAVLTLSSGRFPRADIRHAILLDREIIVGPGTTAHIRVDQADETTTLCLQDGRLYCRSREAVKANHRTLDRENAVPMDTPVQVGEMCFVVTKSE